MLKLLRHVLFLIVAAALLGGTVSGAAPVPAYAAAATTHAEMAAGLPCSMAMSDSKSADTKMADTKPANTKPANTKPGAPCQGMTKDCIDQMGCIAVTALPAHFLIHDSTVRYSSVDYRVSPARLDSLDLVPEPLPPRTI
ncbi:MAG TPA: hypothetical protein VFF19_03345 [Reyranella sp.]|nr:hypothetical protein [Reyranella sp.]